jgi:hypothetical protein
VCSARMSTNLPAAVATVAGMLSQAHLCVYVYVRVYCLRACLIVGACMDSRLSYTSSGCRSQIGVCVCVCVCVCLRDIPTCTCLHACTCV